MKKKYKHILSFALSFYLLLSIVACSPIKRQPLQIGDSVKINQSYVITLDNACASPYDSSRYLLELDFSFYDSNSSLTITENDISISCSPPQKINWDKILTIEKNGYNILNQPLEGSFNYTFIFLIPRNPYFQDLDLLPEDSLGWTINCLVYNKTFNLYTRQLI